MEKVFVVGYIPTPEGEAALVRALDEARVHDARLLVINAPKSGAYVDSRGVQPEDLDALRSRLDASEVPFELLVPDRGADATDFILDVCTERSAALVIIGLRRRSTVGKLVMGSVAQQVLMHADCAILAVRA
jgi:nucleotide-binding universal stress UspA family protein